MPFDRKEYYLKNREKIIQKQKEYNLLNKDKIAEKRKLERNTNPEYKVKQAIIMKRYYNNLKENRPDKYKECLEKVRIRTRKYRDNKKELQDKENIIPTIKELTIEQKKLRQKLYKKKYMEKIKADPEKYKLYKEQCNERVKKCINKKLNL